MKYNLLCFQISGGLTIIFFTQHDVHIQKRASCNKSVGILQQLVTTSRYQDPFARLATAFDVKSVARCQQT